MLCDILEQNGYSDGGITRDGLEQLRAQLLKAGDVNKLDLPGLKPDRIPVLPGGFAIMYAAFCELGIEHMQPALGALREGLLYDLLGRFHHNDMREVTVQQFMRRYHVDMRQAARVAHLADLLARQFLEGQVERRRIAPACLGGETCTRSASAWRTAVTTNTPPISSPTPTCRAFPKQNKTT